MSRLSLGPCVVLFVFSFRFITFATIFLFALALVFTYETFILTAVLFTITILLPTLLPIITPIFAWIGRHDQIVVSGRDPDIVNVAACENDATQESSKA